MNTQLDSLLVDYEGIGLAEQRECMRLLRQAFDDGLACHSNADVKMYPSYVSKMPDGTG